MARLFLITGRRISGSIFKLIWSNEHRIAWQRLYLDTSVFGGYFDEEFAEFTIPLFKSLDRGEFILLFSSVTQEELEDAPANVRELVMRIKEENTEFIETTEEVVSLAIKYIEEKVVGQTSYADCLHIALATIIKADYLISWNFKHIVNVRRIIAIIRSI